MSATYHGETTRRLPVRVNQWFCGKSEREASVTWEYNSMGVGVGLMFDRDVPGTGSFEEFIADGKEFAYEMERLDEICHTMGVPSFSRFCPYDPSDETAQSGETWFDPAHGLETVTRLSEALTSQLESTKGKRKRLELEGLIAALDALKSDLAVARKRKARFALFFY